MVMLLFENALSQKIKDLLRTSSQLRIAVAFIGDGANKWIGPQATDTKIICNLSMGGTNPKEVTALIKRFGGNNVKHIENLHAKVYIGSDHGIISSANMSENGLGTQPRALREAGYIFKLDATTGENGIDWFDNVFSNVAKPITEEDLKLAAENWKKRDPARDGSNQKSLSNICNYDFENEDFPLLTWIGNDKWNSVETAIPDQIPGGAPTFDDAIDDGIEVECNEDREYLSKSGRWVLVYKLRKNGRAPFWTQLSGSFIENCFAYEGENSVRSVAATNHGWDTGPFKIDADFKRAFNELLLEDRYKELIKENYEGGWFAPRIPLMKEFWKELQNKLCGITSA